MGVLSVYATVSCVFSACRLESQETWPALIMVNQAKICTAVQKSMLQNFTARKNTYETNLLFTSILKIPMEAGITPKYSQTISRFVF